MMGMMGSTSTAASPCEGERGLGAEWVMAGSHCHYSLPHPHSIRG